MNFILCGLPRSGKTTIGKILAVQMNWPFIDIDERIEEAYQKEKDKPLSCRQIYLIEGESYFRELEKQQVLALKKQRQSVIATGGGTLHTLSNREILQKLGVLIYLKLPFNEIWARLSCEEIPSFLNSQEPEQAFYKLCQTRLPLYEACAQVVIEAYNLTREEITAAILCHKRFEDGK